MCNSPSLDADEDLAFADSGLGLLQDLDGLESPKAGEHDGAHLLGRGDFFLLFFDGLLRGLFRRGLGGAVLCGGLLGRGGRGGVGALRHCCKASCGRIGAVSGRGANGLGGSEAGRRSDASRTNEWWEGRCARGPPRVPGARGAGRGGAGREGSRGRGRRPLAAAGGLRARARF